MEIIKVYTREKLVELGLCEECNEIQIDIETLSNELYRKLEEKPYDQLELSRELFKEGWIEEDINLCMNYLKRKNQIVYVME